jgi:hypothetical protein
MLLQHEESAFWLLVCLVENILLPKMFVDTLEGCLVSEKGRL